MTDDPHNPTDAAARADLPPPPTPCLSDEALDRCLTAPDDQPPSDLAEHLDACARCADRLREAREHEAFLDRARRLVAPTLQPDDAPRIPGYRTLAVLSAGAQGVVYHAIQESTARHVAIKVLGWSTRPGTGSSPAQSPSSSPAHAGSAAMSKRQRLRAEREAEIAARLRHPHIVSVFESRTLADGRIAMVMEFVRGVPLDAWTPSAADPAGRRNALLTTFILVCRAVHHAHLNGVIHRDLKPDNILVRDDGQPVVLDFGVAKVDHVQATMTGEFAGTPAYASPEQASGHPDRVDALTDVYSLGVILYRLLCNAFPYELSGSIMEMARVITEAPPTPPRRLDPSISPDLEAVLLRALSKDKADRYHSAAELAQDVQRALDGFPVEARSGSGWYVIRKAVAVNRRRLAAFAAAMALVALAAVAVTVSLTRASRLAREEAHQRELAHAETIRANAVAQVLREVVPLKDPSKPDITKAVSAGLARLYLRLETGAFADNPDLDQAVRRIWGGVYTTLGPGRAAELVEYAEVSLRNGLVRLRERLGDVDHPEIASTLHELAAVLLVRKRPAEGLPIAEDAERMRRALFGDGDPRTALSTGLRARTLHALARPDEADALAEQALAVLRDSAADAEHPAVPTLIALRARIALDRGRADRAEPLVADALRRRFRSLPPEDPEITATLALAADLAELDPDLPLSRTLARAWADPSSSTPASNTPASNTTTADAIRADLARLSVPDSRLYPLWGEAPTGRADAFARLLALQEALLGPDDPSIIGTLMARSRAAQNEILPLVRADALLRAADLLAARFGPHDLSVLLCVEQAGSAFVFAGVPERAAEQGRRAGEIWDAVPAHARDPLLAANAHRRLGWYLTLAGRHDEAIRASDRAGRELADAVGARHYLVALALAESAHAHFALGRAADADRLSAQAAQLLDEALAAGTTVPADTDAHIRFVRGHVLAASGAHAEALPLLRHAFERAYLTAPPTFAWRRAILADLRDCALALNDSSQAEGWSRQIEADLAALQPGANSSMPRP